MQQQQHHVCNNSNITHPTTAISCMQQQQYHASNNSNIMHATTANISRMQQQQYHACNNSNIMYATTAISRMQQQQYHARNNSNITHATTGRHGEILLSQFNRSQAWQQDNEGEGFGELDDQYGAHVGVLICQVLQGCSTRSSVNKQPLRSEMSTI